jgi:hypothetical protein
MDAEYCFPSNMPIPFLYGMTGGDGTLLCGGDEEGISTLFLTMLLGY